MKPSKPRMSTSEYGDFRFEMKCLLMLLSEALDSCFVHPKDLCSCEECRRQRSMILERLEVYLPRLGSVAEKLLSACSLLMSCKQSDLSCLFPPDWLRKRRRTVGRSRRTG